jgi:hypothetical protein
VITPEFVTQDVTAPQPEYFSDMGEVDRWEESRKPSPLHMER